MQVNLDVETVVMLPVSVKLNITMNVDNGADVNDEVDKMLHGNQTTKSCIKEIVLREIQKIGSTDMKITNDNEGEIINDEVKRIITGGWK